MSIALAVSAVAGGAHATPPSDADVRAAERIHEDAVLAARDKRWEVAVERWRAAEKLRPVWKYVFNQASASAHLERWEDAWLACRRAWALGVPDEYAPALSELEQSSESHLLAGRAWVEVTVEPSDAMVTRDGEPFDASGGVWLAPGQSRLEITRAGYVSATRLVDHPVGSKLAVAVTLMPVPAAPPSAPPPEPMPVRVAPAEAPTDVRRVWAWASVGTGAAVVAGGAALLLWAGTLPGEWSARSQELRSFDDYSPAYDAAAQRFERARVGGWVCVGVGASLAAAGAVLLSYGYSEDDVTLAPLMVPGGAGGLAHVRF